MLSFILVAYESTNELNRYLVHQVIQYSILTPNVVDFCTQHVFNSILEVRKVNK